MATKGELDVEVRMKFGQRVQGSEGPNVTRRIQLKSDGSDSILEIKQKVAVIISFKSSFSLVIVGGVLELYIYRC